MKPEEELHFRLDEHARQLHDISTAADRIPTLVEGGVSALRAGMKAEFLEHLEALRKTQSEDVESDKAVAEELRAVVGKIGELCGRIDALISVLGAPSTRESTINLPSGPVHMTVRERKN